MCSPGSITAPAKVGPQPASTGHAHGPLQAVLAIALMSDAVAFWKCPVKPAIEFVHEDAARPAPPNE